MGRRPQQQKTFADLVREVETRVPDAPAALAPGLHGDEEFVDQAGRRYRLTAPSVDQPTAQRAAAGGAVVVWDPCGCGGYCGYEWLDPAQVRHLSSALPQVRNTKRHRGCIALYTDEAGGELLLVEGSVIWGSTIA